MLCCGPDLSCTVAVEDFQSIIGLEGSIDLWEEAGLSAPDTKKEKNNRYS